ncbi:MAG: adenosylmethionine--8-amino-7-oxononanoate transaminase [Ferrovum myxofaciens]|uniref:adenosylmethionine--8-amino-7-oxononanoate transaminase n=1 Tax=Ferrovum myxofaciens TaxID=416213 RepID=UPI0023573799|nr:adenosylmethionine--8-amino-7-oxononanoate transaminase [Ferrovum myxofaciens]QKE41823.1 MAG: adenosylmethionine--8-amino-7-oxononanoate transaminase [Ferrovum myxofaciens]
MNQAASWAKRSAAAVWHPCTQMQWLEEYPVHLIQSAQGAWLVEEQGRRVLDAISSWWVNLWGHGHPAIVAALKDQLDRLDHVMLAGLTHQSVVELSERLSARTGGTLGHCFYGSDGASATEMALKMSVHYWRHQGQPNKNSFIALAHGYHGETLGALGVTDIPLFRTAYAALIRGAHTIPAPDSRIPGSEARSLEALATYLAAHQGEVAALILEPLVQAAAGMVFHSPEYVRAVLACCRHHDVHVIADEIAVGFGRTGTFFAYEQSGITPDFLCLSKGITGGFLPLSVVLTQDPLYQAFYAEGVDRAFLHSHSYTGNPLACRAALAVQQLFDETGILALNQARQAQMAQQVAPLFAHPRITQGRQRGMIWACEVIDPPAHFARRFHARAWEAGVLLRPIGHTLYFMPPLNLTGEELDFLVGRTLETLEEVLA